jgi:cytoskeletal protein CcmA (bactofilin family)
VRVRGPGGGGAAPPGPPPAAVQTSRTAAERVTAGSRVAATALGAASTRTAARVRSASDAARAAVAARSTSLRTKGAPPAPVAVPSRASGTVADYGDDAVERIALTPRASAPVEVTQALAEPGGTRVESAPTPPPPAVTPDPDRIVEMEIDGDFSFPMELAVGATVLITEGGRASADISAVHAIVMGTYRGTLRASRTITVGRTAVVEGVLDAPQVQVADGALVNGVRVGLADVGAVPQTDGSTPADDQSIADSSFMDEGTTTAVAEPPAGDDAEPVAHVETASGPEFPPADSARQPTADDEIFVASPIFTDGISRE